MKRNYRYLSEQAHKMIRGAILEGESVTEVAAAWGISRGHACDIAAGRKHPWKPAGAAAGAWKDYGSTCKRGHPRPDVQDSDLRRCKQCDALRAKKYRAAKSHGNQAAL